MIDFSDLTVDDDEFIWESFDGKDYLIENDPDNMLIHKDYINVLAYRLYLKDSDGFKGKLLAEFFIVASTICESITLVAIYNSLNVFEIFEKRIDHIYIYAWKNRINELINIVKKFKTTMQTIGAHIAMIS